jgi:VWFA-related protein
MTRPFPALLLGFTLALPFAAIAQTPAPATPALPAAPSSTGPPAAAPAQGTAAVTTLKARSNLVILDVVVTDKSHKSVHGLKASDFQVKEAGVAQTVKTLEEHTPPATPPPATPPVKLPAGVFTNFTPVPETGPINVLLIDRLNTPMDAQMFLHQQLVEYIKRVKPGTRLAVFGLNRQLIFLQGFTSDPKLLLAALESKKNGVTTTPLLPSAGDTAMSDSLTDMQYDTGAIPDNVLASVQQFEAENQSFQTQLRVRYTLDAMNVLARYLAALPGRKNLIWFSGSFPLSIMPDGDLADPFAAMADMGDEFRDTTNLLTKSQVAVYPIDARGLKGSSMFSAAQDNSKYAKRPQAFSKAIADESNKTADEHITMLQMASETGGEAFVNTNGLADAVEKSIENGSSYYTITYTPVEPKNDGSFRKIQVATTPGGYNLSYRRGYYSDGVPKKERTQLTASTAAPPTLTPQQLVVRNSMLRGAPTPSQILFKVFVGPMGPPTEATVAAMNKATDAAKGPFRQYTVNYAASPADIGFKNVGPGKYEIGLQFLVYVYDSNGLLVNSIGNTIKATVTPTNVKAMAESGLQFHQAISVPAKGDYFLRIGVHDLLVDHVGAVEIPVASVKNLPVVEIEKPKPVAPALSDLPK